MCFYFLTQKTPLRIIFSRPYTDVLITIRKGENVAVPPYFCLPVAGYELI